MKPQIWAFEGPALVSRHNSVCWQKMKWWKLVLGKFPPQLTSVIVCGRPFSIVILSVAYLKQCSTGWTKPWPAKGYGSSVTKTWTYRDHWDGNTEGNPEIKYWTTLHKTETRKSPTLASRWTKTEGKQTTLMPILNFTSEGLSRMREVRLPRLKCFHLCDSVEGASSSNDTSWNKWHYHERNVRKATSFFFF